MVKSIREVEQALGSNDKKGNSGEMMNKFLAKSIVRQEILKVVKKLTNQT